MHTEGLHGEIEVAGLLNIGAWSPQRVLSTHGSSQFTQSEARLNSAEESHVFTTHCAPEHSMLTSPDEGSRNALTITSIAAGFAHVYSVS